MHLKMLQKNVCLEGSWSNDEQPSAHLWQQEQEEQKMSSSFRPYRAAARHLEMGFFKKYCDAGGGIGRLDGMAKGRRRERDRQSDICVEYGEGEKDGGGESGFVSFCPYFSVLWFLFLLFEVVSTGRERIYDPQENGKEIAIRIFPPLGKPPYSISPPKKVLSERKKVPAALVVVLLLC